MPAGTSTQQRHKLRRAVDVAVPYMPGKGTAHEAVPQLNEPNRFVTKGVVALGGAALSNYPKTLNMF